MGSIVNPNNYPAKENVFTILVVALTWAVFGKALQDKFNEEEGTIEAVVSTRV